ncbi:ricin-type beta-trefoil lectin domain protein [Leucobacter viscericola]|uniref:Ricin-type beta-trefoil lectin domain protein n=1 Tax=Leucobacter viscericola TaxID=2714935 RepID=A0A6G7XF88_9MICO|nr:ricin-type beta-trefoil lectin domain protein [Leucobacter viscericola]QIK63109.1 ricin-type beta-trefoil lectin domain protein [Leucobacter viscericola]
MTRSPRNFTKRLTQGAIAITLSIAGVLAGSAAYAALVPAVTASGSVTAGNLSVAVTTPPNATMRNSDSSVAMPFTVTNTSATSSTQKAATSVKFSSDNSAFGVGWVWPVANAAACPTNAAIGTGPSVLPWPAGGTVTTSLAPGESQTYCVRSMQTGTVVHASGSMAMNITTAATLSLGNFQASNQSTARITTKAIYPSVIPADNWYRVKPFGQSRCLDVTGGINATSGALVGTYTCHTQETTAYGNQWFSFKQLSQSNKTLAIRPNGPSGTSMQPRGTSVEVRTTAETSAQQWLLQQVNETTYQMVNMETGLCVTAPTAVGQLTLAVCDDLTSQRFTLTKVNVAIPTRVDVEKPDTGSNEPVENTPEAPLVEDSVEANTTEQAGPESTEARIESELSTSDY